MLRRKLFGWLATPQVRFIDVRCYISLVESTGHEHEGGAFYENTSSNSILSVAVAEFMCGPGAAEFRN